MESLIEKGAKQMVQDWVEYSVVENSLKNMVEKLNGEPKVKKGLEHIIRAGGKRVRPIITMVSGKMCGGNIDEVLDAALAIELIHTASLVHDDIIDEGNYRRNVKCLHREYDKSIALLIGDFLISKSVELISRYEKELIREFAMVGMKMAEGEILDLESVRMDTFTEEDYYRCIWNKTATLFAISSWAGCRIVSQDKEWASHLYNYGKELGLAYQIVDDFLEFARLQEDKSSEFESITLPLIYTKLYGLERGIRKVLTRIWEHVEKAKRSLEIFPAREEKQKLLKIVDYMTVDLIKEYLADNTHVGIATIIQPMVP